MTPQAAHWVEVAASLRPLVRAHAEEGDRHARLAPDIVEALHDSGLNRILLPPDLGGAGLTIPDSLHVIEAVAEADASTGWVLSIYSGSPVFGIRLPQPVFREIFSDPRAVIAGSLGPTARATRVPGGYAFSGKATYASGAWDAPWLQVAGVVFDGDRPEVGQGGPRLVSGVMPMDSVERLPTWDPVGMRGTGSIDCLVKDVFVPEDYTFSTARLRDDWDRGVFGAIPLPLQLGSPLAAAAVGAAAGGLEAFIEMAKAKSPRGGAEALGQNGAVAGAVGRAAGLIDAARATLHSGAERIWERGVRGESFELEFQATARLSSVTAAGLARDALSLLKEHAGTGATSLRSPFGRAWRDVDTMPAHVILGSARAQIVGRALLGLDPGAPFI